jgi:hypothetical protein
MAQEQPMTPELQEAIAKAKTVIDARIKDGTMKVEWDPRPAGTGQPEPEQKCQEKQESFSRGKGGYLRP